VGLADARDRAQQCRQQRSRGIDPIDAKRAEATQRKIADAQAVTFADAAEKYVAAHESGWRSEKHRAQWRSTLTSYAGPVIGDVPVAAIDTALVLKVIEPMWAAKPETASRLRGRIEAVLDWAKVRGFRTGENPARWKGHLSKLMPPRSRVRTVKHHAALPYAELPTFMAELQRMGGSGARALELTILTVLRTSEVLCARRSEFDPQFRVWTVPAERMKAKREHRVPLSERAAAILRALPRENEWLFPGERQGKPVSNLAMLKTLERMGRSDITVHGFRSTFRDWAAERTNFPNHVAEMALAHLVGDKVEAAYRRGDLFEKRRRLMEAWAEYATKAPAASGDVIALRAATG
jgi:integrase